MKPKSARRVATVRAGAAAANLVAGKRDPRDATVSRKSSSGRRRIRPEPALLYGAALPKSRSATVPSGRGNASHCGGRAGCAAEESLGCARNIAGQRMFRARGSEHAFAFSTMTSLGSELIHHTDKLVQRWYEAWRSTPRARPELSESALKDKLANQLQVIGKQLLELTQAENPGEMWRITDRLDPEHRVAEDVPIEEVVQGYGIAVDVVRDWIEERRIEVPFREYSYFYTSIFELVAESVRRYAAYREELVRRDRARYLARVMHQLRTPLSALYLRVERLDHVEHKPDASSIEQLTRNVQRIRVLAESILRLERYRPSEVPLRPEELRPAQLVDDILSDYEADTARKGLRVEAHVDHALRMIIDPELFIDALGNLVQNAVKFTDVGFVSVEAEPQAAHVVFRVRDSGRGMSDEEQGMLFHRSLPGRAGGAGIGLTIAKHAAEAQGGEIHVQSEPGKGSLFSLVLPRSVPARDNTTDL
jgi:signal transduction histidine kinase